VPQGLAPETGPDPDKERRIAVKYRSLRIGAFRQVTDDEALARVREWSRERFALPHDAAILVSEVACLRPGCPPIETLVAFWTENNRRHHFKVFKPVGKIVLDDLPPAWLRDALCATQGTDFGCC
jgi:nitrate reductase delta subunit